MMMSSFPIILQHDAMQCGIACLQMICRYYGQYYSSAYIDKICHATKEGVSMLGISQTAKALGMKTVCGKVSIEQLVKKRPFPCVLHWRQNYFVVLYKIDRKGRRFHIADPGKGLITYGIQEFEKAWISCKTAEGVDAGVVMLFEPTVQFTKKSTIRCASPSFHFLVSYLKKYRRQFFVVSLCLALMTVSGLLLPTLTQQIVDWGIRDKDIGIVWLILIGQMTLTISSTLFDFIRRRMLLTIGMKINISLVSDFFHKLLRLPMYFFDTKQLGDLLQRVKDYSRVEEFLTTNVLNMSFSAMLFITYCVMLTYYNPIIFCIFIVGSTLYSIWVTFFMQRRKVLDYELFEQHAENNNKIYQFITTMQEIKLQQCEQRRCNEWEDVQQNLYHVQRRVLALRQNEEAGSVFINEMKNLFVTVMAATAVINGDMTLGGMLAVQFIIGQLNSPLNQLMAFIYSLQDINISFERINEIHDRDDEDAGKNDNAHCFASTNLNIDISDVSFKYDPHSLQDTLNGITLHIPERKVTAIVGASGSGKTTLIKLLLGYYPIVHGSITIANRELCEYEMKWWRGQCGVVMQDGVIFSESIARNIAVDDNLIDKKRMREAARIACIDEYIDNLPLGYKTKIGQDGQGLSQGQKQRILIARAVYKNPSFIFLDEATNALDANNERQIVKNLDDFYHGKTVVVVAHRLSTVSSADNIVVLEHGTIVEQGTHAELTARRGRYYNLVKNQLELGV